MIFPLTLEVILFIFFMVFTASLGVPTGALFVLMSFGALSTSLTEFAVISLIVFLGAALGDFCSFLIAKKYNVKMNTFVKQTKWLSQKEAEANFYFERYGLVSIFVTKFFLTAVGPAFNYYSGMKKLSTKTFLLLMVSGEVLYSLIYVGIGYIFQETWQDLFNLIGDSSLIVITVIALVYVVNKLRKTLKSSKSVSA